MEPLDVAFCRDAIDHVLDGEKDAPWSVNLQRKGFRLKQATTSSQWKQISDLVGSIRGRATSSNGLEGPIPYFFGMGLHSLNNDDLCGIVTAYIAYSTWDGRCLHIDQLILPDPNDEEMERTILRPLARIAVTLQCARLIWKKVTIPAWYEHDSLPPEILHGWLVLRMEQPAMVTYSDGDGIQAESDVASILSRTTVHETLDDILPRINDSSLNDNFRIRLSTADDLPTIERLVKGLAIYEKEPDAVNVTAENYSCDGGSKEPLFYCLLLEDAKSCPGTEAYCCGMAFIYFGYELDGGRFLYLEDLYLEEPYRKLGGGSLIMKSLARISLALHCQSFCWVALDWNTPALNLYEKIGAKVQVGTRLVRYCDDKLRSFASFDS